MQLTIQQVFNHLWEESHGFNEVHEANKLARIHLAKE